MEGGGSSGGRGRGEFVSFAVVCVVRCRSSWQWPGRRHSALIYQIQLFDISEIHVVVIFKDPRVRILIL